MFLHTQAGQIGLCSVFGFILLSPTLLWPVTATLKSGVDEQRTKTEWLSAANVPSPLEAATAFRNAFNDRFPLRDLAIEADAQIRVSAGNDWTNRVFLGNNGWMFLRQTPEGIPVTLPVDPMTSDELRTWINVFETRRETLAQHGIDYVLIVAPNKATIYPEFRPDVVAGFEPDRRYQQLLDGLQQSTAVRCIDLRPALRHAKSADTTLYFRTDTHWNAVGSRIAHQAICQEMDWQDRFANQESLTTTWSGPEYRGDLSRLLGSSRIQPEPVASVLPANGWRWKLAEYDRSHDPILRNNLAVPESAIPVVTEIPAEQSLPTAVILRDSFTLGLQPFLSEQFRRAVYLWTYQPDLTQITCESPEIVLDIFVERQLHGAPPSAFR